MFDQIGTIVLKLSEVFFNIFSRSMQALLKSEEFKNIIKTVTGITTGVENPSINNNIKEWRSKEQQRKYDEDKAVESIPFGEILDEKDLSPGQASQDINQTGVEKMSTDNSLINKLLYMMDKRPKDLIHDYVSNRVDNASDYLKDLTDNIEKVFNQIKEANKNGNLFNDISTIEGRNRHIQLLKDSLSQLAIIADTSTKELRERILQKREKLKPVIKESTQFLQNPVTSGGAGDLTGDLTNVSPINQPPVTSLPTVGFGAKRTGDFTRSNILRYKIPKKLGFPSFGTLSRRLMPSGIIPSKFPDNVLINPNTNHSNFAPSNSNVPAQRFQQTNDKSHAMLNRMDRTNNLLAEQVSILKTLASESNYNDKVAGIKNKNNSSVLAIA